MLQYLKSYMQQLDDTHINEVLLQISKRVSQALKAGELTSVEAPLVSEYITENKDSIHTHTQLMKFLDQMVIYWPFLEDVRKLEQEHEETEEVQKELNRIRQTLNSDNSQVN